MTDADDLDLAALMVAVRAGNLALIDEKLAQNPALAGGRLADGRGGSRCPLHVATDWPGYFPNGPEVVGRLLAAGADPNARTGKAPGETALHWAASNDDRDVAEVLIDGGADLDAPDGSIGTPLANAVGYGCWQVAGLLARRGAAVTDLWVAAALGWSGRVGELLAAEPPPGPDELSHAFWQACHGGQRRVAERLLGLGADPGFIPDYSDQTAAQVAAEPGTSRSLLTDWLRERGLQ